MKKSMVDVAFDLMTKKKKPVVFLKLWQEVSEIMGFTVAQEEDNIAQFYSDLSLDDRFVNVAENKWIFVPVTHMTKVLLIQPQS